MQPEFGSRGVTRPLSALLLGATIVDLDWMGGEKHKRHSYDTSEVVVRTLDLPLLIRAR
jgi:hypothetical protein